MSRVMTENACLKKLEQLNINSAGEWKLRKNAICRDFRFSDFHEAMAFMNKCAELINTINHHPRWCNTYNVITVSLTTHEVGGLTELDFELAAQMEKVAGEN